MSKRGEGGAERPQGPSRGRPGVNSKHGGGSRPGGEVLRRRSSERKPLPAELEAFAGGDEDALWRRPARPRLNDPRPVVLVPGVANRDARTVYEAREKRLRSALASGDDDALALELAEACRMRLWRAHSVVDRDVFVEHVVGVPPERVPALLARAGELAPSLEPASDDVVAMWMRAEAGLLEGSSGAVARLRGTLGAERLVLEVPIDEAAGALAAVGRRSTPLAREQAAAPRSIVDRPRGLPRLSQLEKDPDET